MNNPLACDIYCEGDILNTIQLSGIFDDSKTFVDMPMRKDPNLVEESFKVIVNDTSNLDQIKLFLNENFEEVGSDIEQWIPQDFQSNPETLNRISDPAYVLWAKELNNLWLSLGRKTSESAMNFPNRHSVLERKYPFIVPGGRFRESYYWDSLFIVKGLLVCEMHLTANNVIQNLLNDINNYGFVPNGGRIYYLDRSQPPVLSDMILTYANYMINTFGFDESLFSFLQSAYSSLKVEYSWWMNPANGHTVTIRNTFQLNRYFSSYTSPRPESYVEDFTTASQSTIANKSLSSVYQDIRAGAETGWDFSSRWIRGSTNLPDISTSEIIPTDLNAIMLRFEMNLAEISKLILQSKIFQQEIVDKDSFTGGSSSIDLKLDIEGFEKAAEERREAINVLLWDANKYMWKDFNLSSDSHSDHSTQLGQEQSISSWIPLWAGLMDDCTAAEKTKVINSLKESQLIQPGGILTTTMSTGQQWDSPNAWPPLQLIMIEGLQRLSTPDAYLLAENLSSAWLSTCYIAYNRTGFMYEKYNAFNVGEGGGGGEYVPQTGFGWSNAVVLVLLNMTTSSLSNSRYFRRYGVNSIVADVHSSIHGGVKTLPALHHSSRQIFDGALVGVLIFFCFVVLRLLNKRLLSNN